MLRAQATRRQIESDDPDLKELTISPLGYMPLRWSRDGAAIGRNTRIEKLYIKHLNADDNCVSRDDFEAFCRGLACNEFIWRLEIHCCGLFGGKIFSMLTPFFEKSNLEELKNG